jgi:hypothetical protein
VKGNSPTQRWSSGLPVPVPVPVPISSQQGRTQGRALKSKGAEDGEIEIETCGMLVKLIKPAAVVLSPVPVPVPIPVQQECVKGGQGPCSSKGAEDMKLK